MAKITSEKRIAQTCAAYPQNGMVGHTTQLSELLTYTEEELVDTIRCATADLAESVFLYGANEIRDLAGLANVLHLAIVALRTKI